MAAQAWFSRSDIEVVPGTSAVFQLTIVNLGDTTETFSLAPVGLAAGWTTIRPGSVTLFGGSQEVVDVEVQPPLLPSTTAGPTALTVRIVPQSDPDDVGSSETTLQVGPTYTRRLHMLQPALRARRTAVYEMMLENQGNTQASCRLHLLDPTGPRRRRLRSARRRRRAGRQFADPAEGARQPFAMGAALAHRAVHHRRRPARRADGQRTGHVRAGVDDPRAAVRPAAGGCASPSLRSPECGSGSSSRPCAMPPTMPSPNSFPRRSRRPRSSNTVCGVESERLGAGHRPLPCATACVDQGTLFSKLLAPAAPAGQTAVGHRRRARRLDLPAHRLRPAEPRPGQRCRRPVERHQRDLHDVARRRSTRRQAGLVGLADRGSPAAPRWSSSSPASAPGGIAPASAPPRCWSRAAWSPPPPPPPPADPSLARSTASPQAAE